MSAAGDDLADYLGFYGAASDALGGGDEPARHDGDGDGDGGAGQAAFCSAATVEQGVRFLEAQLAAAGYPTPLRLGAEATREDLARAVNVLHALFGDRRRQLELREEAASGLARLQEDNRHLQERVAQLRDDVKQADKQRWEVEMRKRVAESDARKAEQRLRAEVAALQKRCVMVQHRDRQYQHELRKREKEYTRLQERLQRMLSDRTKESRAGMDVLNRLKARPGGAGGAAGSGPTRARKAEEELFRQTISAYEERLADVLAENGDLRKSLAGLNLELQEALNSGAEVLVSVGGDDEAPRTPPPPLSPGRIRIPISPDMQGALDDFNAAQIEMPFGFVRQNIEGGLRAKMRLLRDKMAQLREQESRGVSASDAQLRARIAEQERIIGEQDRLIQASLKGRGGGGGAGTAAGDDLLEQSRRWSGMAEIDSERRMLHEARSNQAQSAEELDRRRHRLEMERQAFEEERRLFAAALEAGAGGGVLPVRSALPPSSASSARRGGRRGVEPLRMPQTPAGVNLDTSFGASPVRRMEIGDTESGLQRTTLAYEDDDDEDAGAEEFETF